jgi:translation initiation factor 2B subunit (eIF-2B alpha/beta/delta family)
MHVHMNLQISQKIEIIHTYSFDLAHLCINFQIQISSNEGAVKKTILTHLNSKICQKFLIFVIATL